MKVLHCIPGMGGGGAERQLAYLAGPLRARGWAVHVALVSGGPNLARLEAGEAIVHRLTPAGNYDPRLAWQLARLFRRERPDVVQVWFVQMALVAGALAECFGVPWILSERSSALAYPPTLKNLVRLGIARTADAIVSNSAAGDAYWAERANGRVRRFIIPNALPLGEIDSVRAALPAALPVGPDDDVVLFAGRFGVEKNVGVLLRALAEIVERPRTVAVLCGEGPLRSDVRHEIEARGLAGRLLTPGYVEDIWPLMKRAAVVVATGRFEGRPNTVLEAMAARCPLVVSDIPAHREILDERAARFVRPDDASGIARAIAEVLDNPDKAAARAMAARLRVERWSIEAAAAQYDRVYREVIARRGSRNG